MVIMCQYAMDRFCAGAYSGANHVSVFGDWLKAEREKRGWSQPQIADLAGTSTPTVSRIETGIRGPSRKLARSIAVAFGIDPREALEALMADTPGIEVEYVPNDDTDRSEYMAFFDNAPNDEARRRLKIIAEQVAAAWHNQQEIVDGKEKAG